MEENTTTLEQLLMGLLLKFKTIDFVDLLLFLEDFQNKTLEEVKLEKFLGEYITYKNNKFRLHSDPLDNNATLKKNF